MAKRKKQNKNRASKPSTAGQNSQGELESQVIEPDPRDGNRLLLRIGIVLVAIWMIVLLCIAIWK